MIIIPCYGHTKESLDNLDHAARMAELGIEVDAQEEWILKPVVFLNIDYIHAGIESNETIIGSGDTAFYTNLPLEQVLKAIHESRLPDPQRRSIWSRISQAFKAFFLVAFRGYSMRGG